MTIALTVKIVTVAEYSKHGATHSPNLGMATFTVQGSVAIGAEWFPLKGIGVSGHTGFQYSREKMDRRNENDQLLERTTINYGSFRSSLVFSFYFR